MNNKTVPLLNTHVAYLVSLDGIIPLEVKDRYLEETFNVGFRVREAFWLKEKAIQYPSANSWTFLKVCPSDKTPFDHRFVAWSVNDAVALYKQRQHQQAKYYRERSEEYLATAKQREQTDYYQLIMGKPDPEDTHEHFLLEQKALQDEYISPFTGQTI